MLAQELQLSSHRLIVTRCMRAGESSRQRELTLDALAGNEVDNVLDRSPAFPVVGLRPLDANLCRQSGERDFDGSAEATAIAGARSHTQFIGLTDGDAASGAREGKTCRQARVSCADDEDVHRLGQRGGGKTGWRSLLPPVWLGRHIVGVQCRLHHDEEKPAVALRPPASGFKQRCATAGAEPSRKTSELRVLVPNPRSSASSWTRGSCAMDRTPRPSPAGIGRS